MPETSQQKNSFHLILDEFASPLFIKVRAKDFRDLGQACVVLSSVAWLVRSTGGPLDLSSNNLAKFASYLGVSRKSLYNFILDLENKGLVKYSGRFLSVTKAGEGRTGHSTSLSYRLPGWALQLKQVPFSCRYLISCLIRYSEYVGNLPESPSSHLGIVPSYSRFHTARHGISARTYRRSMKKLAVEGLISYSYHGMILVHAPADVIKYLSKVNMDIKYAR